ncbi:putative Glycoprotein membrane precursor GPI-anchored [Hibiscus syriacus]|uniref:Glycoprotein membrane GPI-anchored n=1 Tax=Hibiscus syriacus TaxID=106335 RepID=A0A6A2Y8D7_HIBSY|nr:putative Glycoprotein membrane precursor GPI-anchored [Hibiscus syriacus]
MAKNDDDVRFADFMFFSSSHSINGPGFSSKNTTTTAATSANDDEDDWGDFINSGTPSRVESVKTQWDKLTGALPLSIFGEEEKEDEGSDFGLNGPGVDVKQVIDLNPKVETWNWNGLNSGLNGLDLKLDTLHLGGNGDASVKKEKNFSSNGYALRMESKAVNLGSSGLNLDSNGSGLGQTDYVLDANVKNSDLVDEEDDDGWEFKAAEPKAETAVEILKVFNEALLMLFNLCSFIRIIQNVPVSNFNMSPLSWDPLGSNVSVPNSNIHGTTTNASSLNSNVVDDNDEFSDDDGWEFKAAEPETHFGSGDTKVKDHEQENPKGAEFSFGFGSSVNGSSEFFGTSDGMCNKPGEWNLGFSFSTSFESQNKQNDIKNVGISSSVGKTLGSDDLSWAFKDATSGNGLQTKEEPKVADASSSGVEDISFGNHIRGNEDTSKNPKGALPLSIFGDAEIETENTLRYEDVSIKHNTSRTGIKDTRPNVSINDFISSLYSQTEIKASLNQISNSRENGLLSSQIVVGSDLANGDDNFDDESWEFKDAVSGIRGENQNSSLGFGDTYEKYSTKTDLNDYVGLYSKLTAELCFVALRHLDKLKKDKSIDAPSGEDSEVKAIEKEIQVCSYF